MKKALPQKIRIIAGKYRGRKISIFNRPGLRPTPDRVRETVFNWLQFEIVGAHVLDTFAGSGAMGLEALSRNAQSVLFCEQDAIACEAIRTYLHDWQEHHGRVVQTDTTQLSYSNIQYDVIFLDPPFSANLHQKMLEKFAQPIWLKPTGKIYLEMSTPHQNIKLPLGLHWYKTSKAGQVYFGLICHKDK